MSRICKALLVLMVGTLMWADWAEARDLWSQTVTRTKTNGDVFAAENPMAMVYTDPGGTLATVYDEDNVLMSQPVTADENGNLTFRADTGWYRIRVTADDVIPYDTYWASFDPTSADSLIADFIRFGMTVPADPDTGDTYFSGTSLRTWDGSAWVSGVGGSGIGSVAEDVTPQLGGPLDVNGKQITSTANGNVEIVPNGIGTLVLDQMEWPQSDGSADQVMVTDGAGNLSWADQTGGGGVTDHGALTGLSDDDHPLYLTQVEGDAAYTPLSHASDTSDPHSSVTNNAYSVSWFSLSDQAPSAQQLYTKFESLGSAAAEDVGTAVSDVVQLQDIGGGTAGLPAVDGSNLTGLPSGVNDHGALLGLLDNDHTQYSLTGHAHTEADVTVSTNEILLGRLSSGSGAVEELASGDFPTDTTPTGNTAIGFTAGGVLTLMSADSIGALGGVGSGIDSVGADTSPTLGGTLDVAGNSIVSTSNGDIEILPNGTGAVVLDQHNWPQSDGTPGQFLVTDGFGALSFTTASGTGDVIGPSGGVVEGELALFDGITGKAIQGSSGATLVAGTISGISVWECVQELYCNGAGDGIIVSEDYATDVAFQLTNSGVGSMNLDMDADAEIQIGLHTIAGDDSTLLFNGFKWPTQDGTSGQVLTTNGADSLYFSTASGGAGIDSVGADLSPTLGGNLDVAGYDITASGGVNIDITPATGAIVLDGLSWPTVDGASGQVLSTNGAGALSWADDATGGTANQKAKFLRLEGLAANDEPQFSKFSTAVTIDSIFHITKTGTITWNMEERNATTPFTAGVDVFASDVTTTTTGTTASTFSNDLIDAGDWLVLSVTSVSAGDTLIVAVTYTEN